MFPRDDERADGFVVNGFPCSVLRDSDVLFILKLRVQFVGRIHCWDHSLDAMPGPRENYPTPPSDGVLRCLPLSEMHPHPAIMHWVFCVEFSLAGLTGRVENRSPSVTLRLKEDWG